MNTYKSIPTLTTQRSAHGSFQRSIMGATPRKPRRPLNGKIRVLIDFDPWRLMFHLDGANISETGLLGILRNASGSHDKNERHTQGLDRSEAVALFTTGDPYTLQIEHDCPALAAPIVTARLRIRRETASGLELAFAFDQLDADVALLVDELASRTEY